MKIGINLAPLTPFTREWVFRDALRTAGPVRPSGETPILAAYDGRHPPGAYAIDADFHLLLPGAGGGSEFHPIYTASLRPFACLRFMDWQKTNSSATTAWSGRSLPSETRQTGASGVCLEFMIDLANETRVDPWFCMPHLADDSYIESFARLVLRRLAPERRVHVEFSNELWNHALASQGDWILSQMGWGKDGRPAPGATSTQRMEEVVAPHLSRVFGIWSKVFAVAPSRLIRVVAEQVGQAPRLDAILRALGADGFDAVATAAYFRPERSIEAQYTASTTPVTVLADCLRDVQVRLRPKLLATAAIADCWRKPFLLYEGGQSLVPKMTACPDAYYAAQTHPAMLDCYRALFALAREANVALFDLYNFVRADNANGCWGHLSFQDDPGGPKWAAIQEALAA